MRKILFENEIIIIHLENGILTGTFKKDFLDLKTAEQSVKDRLSATEDKSYPVLIDIRNVRNTTKAARQFLASEKGCKGITSGAILINSTLGSIIGNFFIHFDKPLIPTKLYTDEEDAKQWLKKYLD